MAEIPSAISGVIDTSALGNTLQGAQMVFLFGGIIILLLIAIGGLFWYLMWKKSFKWSVYIMRPVQGKSGAFKLETHYRGKHFLNKKKEMRFKIMKAKKYNLLYNNEPIDQKYIIWGENKGVSQPIVIMQPNSEGWLLPVTLSLSELNKLESDVTNADMTYYQSELETMDSVFAQKGFLEKYYLLILVLFLIVILIMQGCQIRSTGKVADTQREAAQMNVQAVDKMSQALTYAVDRINGTGEPSKIPQVINLG